MMFHESQVRLRPHACTRGYMRAREVEARKKCMGGSLEATSLAETKENQGGPGAHSVIQQVLTCKFIK